jgi:hypothetical protein
MPARRNTTLELNFDSLTDTITNLCGGLILLVMLVVGGSHPKLEGQDDLPPPEQKVGGDSHIDQLLRQMQAISAQLDQVQQETQRAESRLPDLEREIEELNRKSNEKSAARKS